MGFFGLGGFNNDETPVPVNRPDMEWIGEDDQARIQRVIRYYERYDGKQVWRDYKKPTNLDFNPTLLTVNYDRLLIDTMATWEFSESPKHEVEPKIIDDPIDMVSESYAPSSEQDASNRRAAAKELLINEVHRHNRTHEKLLEAAKDRKIGGMTWAKLVYDSRTGKIRLMFRPDFETVAKYDHDDEELLTEVHFVHYLDAESTRMWKQSYYLEWDPDKGEHGDFECYTHEATYEVGEGHEIFLEDTTVEKSKMNLNFIPVVGIPNERLSGMVRGYSEIEKIADITDEINRKLSDYSDALRFEMFAITLLSDVENPGSLKVSPGALWDLGDGDERVKPDAKKLESNFRFKDAIEAYLNRLYANLHKTAEVPSVNTAEMNVGGINDMAVRLLFSSIIQKTERNWVIWGSRLQLLNEYILRYMKARANHPRFSYDRSKVSQIDDNYDNTVHFRLPLPEDQAALIQRLTDEMATDLESVKGALARKGEENPEAKLMEIMEERRIMERQRKQAEDPYGNPTPEQTETPDDSQS